LSLGSAPASAATAANPAVCPYLGLVDDPRTHFAFATGAHRCHSGSRPEGIEVSHQAALCLTAGYVACPRYIPPGDATAGLVVTPGPVQAPIARFGGLVRWRSMGPRRRVRRAAVVPAAVVLVGLLTVAIVAAVILGQGGFAVAGPTGTAGSGPTASPAVPTASRQPTPAASSARTSGPTASPIGSVAALPATHIVQRGENLTSIARLYGVSLAALEKVNGIKNPSLITVGQHLIIPPR